MFQFGRRVADKKLGSRVIVTSELLTPEEKTLEWEGLAPKKLIQLEQDYRDDNKNTTNQHTLRGIFTIDEGV